MRHAEKISVPIELDVLSRMLADLRYDKLATFIGHLVCDLSADAARDESAGRKQLARHLDDVARQLRIARSHVDSAWRACESHMDEGS